MSEPALKRQKKEESVKREDSDDGEDDSGPNWWELDEIQVAKRGEKRWDTLSHNGVMFPPEYVPHGIPIRYEGRVFNMTPEEEEVATMFAVLKESDYYRMDVFRRNFFRCWRKILDRRPEPHPIRDLALCDFEDIYQWSVREREKRRSLTTQEKKKIKAENDAAAEPYRYCLWDGKREQVANFRVEPPGLFRGRGAHPQAGMLKKRVRPEDITINIGEEAEVPPAGEGHKWAEVRHDKTVTWLAMWRDNVTGNFKYVMLAPSSAVKGQSDYAKFEKARSLGERIDSIRASYEADFSSSNKAVAQRAVAMYFIDKLALRVGNEKGEDEADTVGCCSLRVEHITLEPGNKVAFDFLGKDSIRYQNTVEVLPQVWQLLQRFTARKRPDDDVFDELTTTALNEHLKSFMDGLSAKVFRTYNASITLDRWFKEKPVDPNATLADKLAYFNQANTEVAILCNHQKSVSKNFHVQMHNLSAETQYLKTILELLEKSRETEKKKSYEAAAAEFYAAHDKIQRDWLDEYGTDEQKKEFEELVKARSAPRKKSSSSASGSKKRASGSKTKSTSSTKRETGKKTAKKAAKKAAKKTAKKAAKKATKKAGGSGKSTKAAAASSKKRTSAKKEKSSDDDDDVPLSALLS